MNAPMSDPSMTGDLGTARDYVLRYVAQMQVGVEFRPEFILAAGGDRFPKKEIYNALTYMARTGDIKRVGYGRYEVATDVECNLSWQFRAETAEARIAELEAALGTLEGACDALAASRGRTTYISMIANDKATDILDALDAARRAARNSLVTP